MTVVLGEEDVEDQIEEARVLESGHESEEEDVIEVDFEEAEKEVLGNCLGHKVLEVDVEANGRNNGEFFRIRVEWPVDKPLLMKLAIKPQDKAQVTRYYLKYERIPHFCFYCGRIGHAENSCSQDKRDGCGVRFGAYLRAPPFKKFEHRRWTVGATVQQPRGTNQNIGNTIFSKSDARQPAKVLCNVGEQSSKLQCKNGENKNDAAVLSEKVQNLQVQSEGQNMMVFQSTKDKGGRCLSNLAKKVVQTKHRVNRQRKANAANCVETSLELCNGRLTESFTHKDCQVAIPFDSIKKSLMEVPPASVNIDRLISSSVLGKRQSVMIEEVNPGAIVLWNASMAGIATKRGKIEEYKCVLDTNLAGAHGEPRQEQ